MRNLLLIALLVFPVLVRGQTSQNGQWIAFNRAGAPNSSLQCFTPNNVSVSDGNLVITTKAEKTTCSSFDLAPATHNYTSGFVAMRSFNFLYGTVEIRAKLASGGDTGSGAWPVLWMMDAGCQLSDPTGTDNNCNGNEIDLAEVINSDDTKINQELHVPSQSYDSGCQTTISNASQNFHTYDVAWSAGTLVFSVDGTTSCTVSSRNVPSTPMFVKMTVFTGFNAGHVKNGTLPWTTLIDYVKVTQGSTVVFNDDFNRDDTIQPAQVVMKIPSSSYHASQTSIRKTFSCWSLRVLIICLLSVIAVAAFKFCRPKRKTEKTFSGVAEKIK